MIRYIASGDNGRLWRVVYVVIVPAFLPGISAAPARLSICYAVAIFSTWSMVKKWDSFL